MNSINVGCIPLMFYTHYYNYFSILSVISINSIYIPKHINQSKVITYYSIESIIFWWPICHQRRTCGVIVFKWMFLEQETKFYTIKLNSHNLSSPCRLWRIDRHLISIRCHKPMYIQERGNLFNHICFFVR